MENSVAGTAPAKTVARDVFLYLLMIFVLASSAGALGTILFALIEQYVPGAANSDSYYYGAGYVGSALKFPVATLIVMFPALVWVVHFLKRDMLANPEKRDLKIRKWLLYFTLFVAGLIVLGDLVALVLGLLDGNTAIRFILKVFVVLWIGGSIFFYFLKDLHDQAPAGRRVIEWATIGVVIVSLVVSLYLVVTQRAFDRDARRVNDLSSLEYQVLSYWQAKGTLPPSLNNLADGTIGGSMPVPVDPKTSAPYEYAVTGDKTYRFCAVFETDSKDLKSGRDMPLSVPMYYGGEKGMNWSHGVGRVCFDGTIDPDRYPPIKR